MGCMSFFVIGLIGFFALFGCGWFFYVKAVNAFTADAPVSVAVSTPSEQEFAAAETKLNQVRNAIRENRATTIAFTAEDVNALIARDSQFESCRGKVHLGIANSLATLEMSASLRSVPFPRLQNRWFNGSARFRFSYDEHGFDFDPEWIEANGHEIRGSILRSLGSSFSSGFTKSFEDASSKNGGSDFWGKIQTMSLENEQLIIVTRGEAGTTI